MKSLTLTIVTMYSTNYTLTHFSRYHLFVMILLLLFPLLPPFVISWILGWVTSLSITCCRYTCFLWGSVLVFIQEWSWRDASHHYYNHRWYVISSTKTNMVYNFGVKYYAALVTYDATNFMTKNMDTLPDNLLTRALESTNNLIHTSFENYNAVALVMKSRHRREEYERQRRSSLTKRWLYPAVAKPRDVCTWWYPPWIIIAPLPTPLSKLDCRRCWMGVTTFNSISMPSNLPRMMVCCWWKN